MLEAIAPLEALSKEASAAKLAALEPLLFHLERKAHEAKIPVLILVEGLAGADPVGLIRELTEKLDPRALRVVAFREPRGPERDRPWLWRFWMRLPNRGEIAIFDTSWYRHVISDRALGGLKRKERAARLAEIKQTERQLVDDGHVLVKLWLHLPRREQERRLKRADKDPNDFWDVTAEEWEQSARYDDFVAAADEAISETSTPEAPWAVIECSQPRAARVRAFEAVCGAIRARLEQVAPASLADLQLVSSEAERRAAEGARAGALAEAAMDAAMDAEKDTDRARKRENAS